MSLSLVTKGYLNDYIPTGTGTGDPIYVLENFEVNITQENIEVAVNELEDIQVSITDITIDVELNDDEVNIIVSDEDTIDIEV